MIDMNKVNVNELTGQFELSDYIEPQTSADAPAEGYDENGNLMDIDREEMKRQTGCYPEDLAVEPQDAGLLVAANAQADAARLDALAAEINAITEQTRGVVISAALAVGKRLIEAKGLVPEGRFGEWLAKSVSYSERKAQDMMRLYVEYGRDGCVPESIAALDYSKAVALLSAPAEDRDALAEKASTEGLSVRQLQDEIKALKIERAKGQMRIDELEGRVAGQTEEIQRMDERERAFDAAIVREREAASLADARAKAAEASAQELRKLHQDAEDRAAAAAQRASDAVSRANQTARELSEAKAEAERLQEALDAWDAEAKTVETVEVVPDDVKRELEQLRRELEEAKAKTAAPVQCVTAAEKFRWFYSNQLQPVFKTARDLLKEVEAEDKHTAEVFRLAVSKACEILTKREAAT